MGPVTPDAEVIAETIAAGFHSYVRQFDVITARASEHFVAGDWEQMRRAATARLELYPQVLSPCVTTVTAQLGDGIHDRAAWIQVRRCYAERISLAPNALVAETWFNSVSRRVWDTVGVDPEIDFVGPSGRVPDDEIEVVSVDASNTRSLVRGSLDAVDLEAEWVDLDADLDVLVARLADVIGDPTLARVEMVPQPFFRGRACYLVGRIVSGDLVTPLIYSIRNPGRGLCVDAVITDEDRVSILFSFTRSYFHVRAPEPGPLVRFLTSIMPRKRIAELFVSIGYNKHGKTELYRDLLDHLARTDQVFDIAPGQRGLVMTVYAMPDYDIVFKIIKDSFPPPKRTTRGQIREKYRLVFEHDRAGRLVEAHEFEHLSLDRARFAPSLVELLLAEASRTVRVDGDRVIIDHAYLERRVTPLDLFVRDQEVRGRECRHHRLRRCDPRPHGERHLPG